MSKQGGPPDDADSSAWSRVSAGFAWGAVLAVALSVSAGLAWIAVRLAS